MNNYDIADICSCRHLHLRCVYERNKRIQHIWEDGLGCDKKGQDIDRIRKILVLTTINTNLKGVNFLYINMTISTGKFKHCHKSNDEFPI